MVSMVNWSSAILRYCNHARAGIQFLYPVPCGRSWVLKIRVLSCVHLWLAEFSGLVSPLYSEVQVSEDDRNRQFSSCEK